jgi:K+-sensing histidine kinase KdpD
MVIDKRDFIFQTTIKNTGAEIARERIPNMMKLFGELLQKQSIHKVKDKGIGVGLTCSKTIADAMSGDLKIVENEEDYPCTTL